MTDSEIPELCRKIYRRHRKALDLIYEHRPDLQADVAQVLKGLVEAASSEGLILDHAEKSAVYFALAECDRHPAQFTGQGWTPSKRVLLFEFLKKPNGLWLTIYIGPAPQKIRDGIFEGALKRADVFNGHQKGQAQKWTLLYNQGFLTAKDYEEADIESLTPKVTAKWEDFLRNRLPGIRQAIEQLAWQELDVLAGS